MFHKLDYGKSRLKAKEIRNKKSICTVIVIFNKIHRIIIFICLDPLMKMKKLPI